VRGFDHLTPADTFDVDVPFAHADQNDYDAVVIPGGVANADFLRMDRDAVRFVEQHVAAGKPIAAICHGPWLLVEADVVRGKVLTSFPSLATDIRNAGGQWRTPRCGSAT
jgi:protease I